MISTLKSVKAFTKVGVLKNAAIYSLPLFPRGVPPPPAFANEELNIDENLAASLSLFSSCYSKKCSAGMLLYSLTGPYIL